MMVAIGVSGAIMAGSIGAIDRTSGSWRQFWAWLGTGAGVAAVVLLLSLPPA